MFACLNSLCSNGTRYTETLSSGAASSGAANFGAGFAANFGFATNFVGVRIAEGTDDLTGVSAAPVVSTIAAVFACFRTGGFTGVSAAPVVSTIAAVFACFCTDGFTGVSAPAFWLPPSHHHVLIAWRRPLTRLSSAVAFVPLPVGLPSSCAQALACEGNLSCAVLAPASPPQPVAASVETAAPGTAPDPMWPNLPKSRRRHHQRK